MWDLLNLVFQGHGLGGLVYVTLVFAVIFLFRLLQKKQDEIVSLCEKRVRDVTESKEDYEELAHKLDQSFDLFIKVFKRNGG